MIFGDSHGFLLPLAKWRQDGSYVCVCFLKTNDLFLLKGISDEKVMLDLCGSRTACITGFHIYVIFYNII